MLTCMYFFSNPAWQLEEKRSTCGNNSLNLCKSCFKHSDTLFEKPVVDDLINLKLFPCLKLLKFEKAVRQNMI